MSVDQGQFSQTLRQILREATATEHDLLDARVTKLDFADIGDYRRFLRLQLLARRPVEAWLGAQTLAFAAPPALAGLLAADLREIGGDSEGSSAFAPPVDADAIGACWAVAGSSLGNRTMHRALLKTAPDRPASFLADGAMSEYWQGLKPMLEQPADDAGAARAVDAARAVFAAFLAAADTCLAEPAS
jgi:heme oxygenase